MQFSEPISYRTEDYMFSYQNIPPHRLTMHLHKMYEILWLMKGDASYIVGNKTYRLNRGDIVVTRPNELHTIIFHSDEIYERCFLQFTDEFASFLNSGLTSFSDKIAEGADNIIKAETAERYGLYNSFCEIAENTVNQPHFAHTAVQAHITLMLIRLNEIFSSSAFAPRASEPNDRIEKVAAYLNKHTNATLDELSARFYINKYHLCHSFKERYGITVKEFINTRRIAKAKMLIEEGHSITELCYLCGFNDYTTFYKTFKKFTGKTPSDFFAGIRTEKE